MIAPVLAIGILLAMTGAPDLIRSARAVPNAPPVGVSATPAASEAPPQSAAAEPSGVYTVDGAAETSDGGVISSSNPGESAVLVKNGGSLAMKNATLTKSGDTLDAAVSASFGLNAALLASGGAASIYDSAVTTAGEGATAIFTSGAATVEAFNANLTTSGTGARGIAAAGGTISARSAEISTAGLRSEAVAAGDGGTVTIDDAALSTTGDLSPILHAAGEISARNLTGAATASRMVEVEGGDVALSDSDLSGAGENGILLYQVLRDAARTATFTAVRTNLASSAVGPFFLVTNTAAEATLSGSTLSFSSGILAQVSGNNTEGLGEPGENGGDFSLTGVGQVLSGDVTVDAISAFSLKLTNGSIYTGAIDASNVGASVSVLLDETSSWTLTADSHVDALTNLKTDLTNIQSDGFLLYYNAENPENAWLSGRTLPLPGGGSLVPEP